MNLSTNELLNIGRFTDVSAVRTDVAMTEVEEMINIVRKYNCICAAQCLGLLNTLLKN